jgi:hypothetical protein
LSSKPGHDPAGPTVRAPILVIGSHRSGTSMMSRALGLHEDVGYWEEPRHVWAWGHNYRGDDRLEARDATPRVARHIRNTFARFLAESGRPRFLEKTPSNCLRLPFIHAVFPDARYIHIYRDGRAVVRSTREMMVSRGPDAEWFLPRLLGTPVWEWPSFAPRVFRTLGSRLMGKGMRYWGPQPPGWRAWLRDDPTYVMLAKQWAATVEPVLDFAERVDRSQWLDVRYEEFVEKPHERMLEILEFAGLPPSDAVLGHVAKKTDGARAGKWRDELEPPVLGQIRPILEPVLERMGYAW